MYLKKDSINNDLKNFTKRWGVNKDWSYNNLAKDLFSQCAHGSLTLSLLRIPVEKLNKDKLRVRCLNELFRSSRNTYHTMEGTPARYNKRYTTKGKALEYIYLQEIDAKDVEVLGSVENFREILRKKNLKGLLLELFKGEPEENCIKTLH